MKRIIGLAMIAGVTYAGLKAVHSAKEIEPQKTERPVEVTVESTGDETEVTDDEQFTCKSCEKKFDTEHGRNVHFGIVHKDDSE